MVNTSFEFSLTTITLEKQKLSRLLFGSLQGIHRFEDSTSFIIIRYMVFYLQASAKSKIVGAIILKF